MTRDGENGYIYPKGDFYQLAKKIKEIADDGELYERMSHSAYMRYATELNSKKMTAETEGFYAELYDAHIKKDREILSTNGKD